MVSGRRPSSLQESRLYRCQKCKTVVAPGMKLNRVVVETRPKTYPVYGKAKGRKRKKSRRMKFQDREHIAMATGHEIAKELRVCAACAAALTAEMAS